MAQGLKISSFLKEQEPFFFGIYIMMQYNVLHIGATAKCAFDPISSL